MLISLFPEMALGGGAPEFLLDLNIYLKCYK